MGWRLIPKRSSPRIGECDINAKPTPEYAARKEALTDEQARFSLELAEEAIAVDPDHRNHRRDVDGIVYDYGEPGIMVSFVIEDGEILYLKFFVQSADR